MDHRLGDPRRAGGPSLIGQGRTLVLCGLLLAIALPVQAQSSLRGQCADASNTQVREFCENVADATAILQPRVGIALSGGNPVPGTASTLGMRLGSLPRVSLGLRVTAAALELPPVQRVAQQQTLSFPVGGISADASVGLYQGIPLLPTVGGFGSLDLLASAGVLPLPRGEGFDDGAALSWAVGARLGLLRESFTAPGVSIDVMYRSVGDIAYGSRDLTDRDAFLRIDDNQALSVRGVVGKRLLGFGATAGIGYDHYRSAITGRVADPILLQPDNTLDISQGRLTSSRMSLFGNASLTLLILNLGLEAGWQRGGSVPTGAAAQLGKGGLFGGIAVRLAI